MNPSGGLQRRIKFSPALWRKWLQRQDLDDATASALAPGIREFQLACARTEADIARYMPKRIPRPDWWAQLYGSHGQ